MEYWNFSKKELDLIADFMLQVLLTKPDKSELSAMNLFCEAIRSEYVKGEDKVRTKMDILFMAYVFWISSLRLANFSIS